MFIGVIPLFVESEAIYTLSQLTEKDMGTICTAATYSADSELPAYLDSKYNSAIFSFAKKYDGRSTQFLNEFMCSEMCPCYDERMIEENINGIVMSEWTPR